MIKLSLVVPIYGVEKYINRFLTSLEKNLQTGIEVLLIDDGTKDNSGKIADQFALEHPEYVKVVHKENGGASSARNVGLSLATGEYIVFPDSDDFLADDFVTTILNSICQYNEPDILLFDYYVVKEEEYELHTVKNFKTGIISKEIFINEFIKDKEIKSFLANKAIARKFFNELRFNVKTRVAEDYEVLTEIVLNIEKIAYNNKPLYYYVMREDSLTHTMSLDDLVRFYELSVDRYRKFLLFDKNISTYGFVNVALQVLMRNYTTNYSGVTSVYKKSICDNIFKIVFDKEFSFNEKKKYLLVWLRVAPIYYRFKYKN